MVKILTRWHKLWWVVQAVTHELEEMWPIATEAWMMETGGRMRKVLDGKSR